MKENQLSKTAVPTIIREPLEPLEQLSNPGSISTIADVISSPPVISPTHLSPVNCFHSIEPSQSLSSCTTIATASSPDEIPMSPPVVNIHCMECVNKDKIIDTQIAQIRKLRKSLEDAQKKTWHLEKTKRELATSLAELKKQSIIDEELLAALEVFIQTLYQ